MKSLNVKTGSQKPLLSLVLLGSALLTTGCVGSSSADDEQSVAQLGDSSAATEKAYRYLQQYGYLGDEKLPGDPQIFHDKLRQTLVMFQEIHGLPADGALNKKTAALMAQPRCSEPDHDLVKRYQDGDPSASYVVDWQWPKRQLTYQHANYTSDLSQQFIQTSIGNAFSAWSNAHPVLTFSSQLANADVDVRFATGSHGDDVTFDGPNGLIAHYTGPSSGRMHFDDAELWTTDGSGGQHFPAVAIHSAGHVLGLGHSADPDAIMRASFGSQTSLGADDLLGIRTLYPPLAPNPLQVFSEACYGANYVQWAGQNGATRYELYRSSSPSFSSQVLLFSGNSTGETITVPTNGSWYLRVRACTATNCGDYSNTGTASYFPGCP